ncbi:MAG: hypothetical protein HZB39_16105 [Planctomycetes bacterium]|nr:hypothetical protein [Planctomycetota bacterium]
MNTNRFRRVRAVPCAVCAVLLVLGAVTAQDGKPSAPQDPVAEMNKTLADAGLVVDTKGKTIVVPAVMGRPADPIEFVLVHKRGKAHEALFVTDVKASILNTAFLLLGFTPGENAKSVERDPLPTAEEVAAGVPFADVFPPKGMNVWFTVRWKKVDADGNEVGLEVALEDLILDLATQRSIEDVEWIYLGGNLAPLYRNEPPVFIGDYEGNLVSQVYRAPPNHLVTVSHKAADDDERWWLTETVPPPDTPIEFVVHKDKPKLHVERDAAIAKRRADEKEGAKKDG